LSQNRQYFVQCFFMNFLENHNTGRSFGPKLILPCDFRVVGQLGLHELLPGDGLLDGRRHSGGGLTNAGITLDFRGTGQTERL
jgi:hypothetical protein